MGYYEKDKISEEIASLPVGNITYKTINGKKYPYLQWTENGKQRSRTVKKDELEELSKLIEIRKSLEKQKKKTMSYRYIVQEPEFNTIVTLGADLLPFVERVRNQKRRECYQLLHEYVYGEADDKVFILYGLRRTGKTTLIRQVIGEMNRKMLAKTAFMQVNHFVDLKMINQDLKQLASIGYQYIFIDEVTSMNDFIESAALFSDVYATRGIKIILSGTDSLGFVFSEDQELYDRCVMAHTTFIPYREFEEVLGIKGIDQYIQYGGTMSRSGTDYHQVSTFESEKSTNEYVDIAIAKNIQHSLKNYQYGNHFRALAELYQADELTSAINRIVEDMNHRFTLEVLTREFTSSDLALSAKNLLKDRKEPTDILYEINKEKVTEELKNILEIKNKYEQKIRITEEHQKEIKEYLDLLDLTVDIPVYYMGVEKYEMRTAIAQPGLRYSQAESLVKSLLKDVTFNGLSKEEKNRVISRILDDVKGRMLEDIVLLETILANPKKTVFKLMFDVGEFDMVICDEENATCEIYEIKHSSEMNQNQIKHLVDEKKCEQTEHQYGRITGKYVLYRGGTTEYNGIQYQNVEEYLKSIVR